MKTVADQGSACENAAAEWTNLEPVRHLPERAHMGGPSLAFRSVSIGCGGTGPFYREFRSFHRAKTLIGRRGAMARLPQSALVPWIVKVVEMVPRLAPDEIVVPFMNHIATSPLVSRHRMSA
jgi:hypothetical protein